jgi:hypothetical protein
MPDFNTQTARYFTYSDEKLFAIDADGNVHYIDLLIEDDTVEILWMTPPAERFSAAMWQLSQEDGIEEWVYAHCDPITVQRLWELIVGFWIYIDNEATNMALADEG